MNFISIKGPELLNMYIGESEKNIRNLFSQVIFKKLKNNLIKNFKKLIIINDNILLLKIIKNNLKKLKITKTF